MIGENAATTLIEPIFAVVFSVVQQAGNILQYSVVTYLTSTKTKRWQQTSNTEVTAHCHPHHCITTTIPYSFIQLFKPIVLKLLYYTIDDHAVQCLSSSSSSSLQVLHHSIQSQSFKNCNTKCSVYFIIIIFCM